MADVRTPYFKIMTIYSAVVWWVNYDCWPVVSNFLKTYGIAQVFLFLFPWKLGMSFENQYPFEIKKKLKIPLQLPCTTFDPLGRPTVNVRGDNNYFHTCRPYVRLFSYFIILQNKANFQVENMFLLLVWLWVWPRGSLMTRFCSLVNF